MNTTFLKPVQGRKWILLLFLSVWFLGNSQTKLRVEPGLLIKTQSENLGLSFNVEPHLEVSTRSVIGLRFGIAVNSQEFETISGTRFFIDEENDNAVISFVPTFDYYLNYAPTRPYLGVGVGYYLLSTVDVSQGIETILDGSIKNQLGLLLRGGVELRNTRISLEYNLIPTADIQINNGEVVGTVKNTYLGLSFGFTIIGRKSSI